MAAQQVAAARKTTDAPTFIHALRFSIVRYNGSVKTSGSEAKADSMLVKVGMRCQRAESLMIKVIQNWAQKRPLQAKTQVIDAAPWEPETESQKSRMQCCQYVVPGELVSGANSEPSLSLLTHDH
jgi:hypothetical protein